MRRFPITNIRRIIIILSTIAGLAACEQAPRAVAYFERHPEEAAEVIAGCAAGTHRGEECVTAQAAQIKAQRAATMDAYRQGFEGSKSK